MLYAIVDIETTGSYALGNGITEIAIVIHDGENVLNFYETLVNPHRPIPFFIQSLTGINNDMVANAPSFE
jgi:DNA polymerase-3 subunit epsilon